MSQTMHTITSICRVSVTSLAHHIKILFAATGMLRFSI